MTQPLEAAVFGREAESTVIREQLCSRKSFLLHGPAGIGKTLLIRRAMRDMSRVAYCEHAASPQAIFKSVTEFLIGATQSHSRQVRSAVALKGIALDLAQKHPLALVLDHLDCPSSLTAAAVRELMATGAVIVSIARSAHMEDAGHLLPLYPFRDERVEVRPFSSEASRGFVECAAAAFGVVASNRDEFLARVVEYGKGNPGKIIAMLQKAAEARYRAGDHIKIAPLYVDFRLEWNAIA
jgi:hypothetical protein